MTDSIPLTSSLTTPPCSFQELFEQYRRHGLSVRGVATDTVDEELLYVKRFLAQVGPLDTPAELLTRLDPQCVGSFLVDYAEQHGPGSPKPAHGTRPMSRSIVDTWYGPKWTHISPETGQPFHSCWTLVSVKVDTHFAQGRNVST